MLALQLTDVKDFMNKFLRSETFDHFLLQEGVITSGASYVIDGHIHPDFYTSEEMEELEITDCDFLPYALLRGNCFDLIKGKKTPSSFKFVLLLSPKNLERTLSSIQSSFTGNRHLCTCSSSRIRSPFSRIIATACIWFSASSIPRFSSFLSDIARYRYFISSSPSQGSPEVLLLP